MSIMYVVRQIHCKLTRPKCIISSQYHKFAINVRTEPYICFIITVTTIHYMIKYIKLL